MNASDNDGNSALHFWENPDYGRMDYRDYLKNYRQNVKNLLRIGIHINIFNTSKGKNALETLLEYKHKYQNLLPVVKIYYQDAAKFLHAAGETLGGTEEEKIPEELKFEDEKSGAETHLQRSDQKTSAEAGSASTSVRQGS